MKRCPIFSGFTSQYSHFVGKPTDFHSRQGWKCVKCVHLVFCNNDPHGQINWHTIYKLHVLIWVYPLKKTRRTRMLTRMLMAQMSKHMDMQSRRTLFCNSLFEQSCTYFPCYQSAVWSGKCRVWSVEWKV